LNFFQHHRHLKAGAPRVSCEEHGIHRTNVPWSRQESGFTLVVQLFTHAMDEARRVEARKERMPKGTRWTTLKGFERGGARNKRRRCEN
jgi:hypothetical protein